MNQLINSLTQFQFIYRLIGGHWHLIADYQIDTHYYWLRDRPDGYHVLDVEDW